MVPYGRLSHEGVENVEQPFPFQTIPSMSGKAQWWLGTGVVVSPLDHNPKMTREDDMPFLVHSQGGALVSWGGGGGGSGCCCSCVTCVWG